MKKRSIFKKGIKVLGCLAGGVVLGQCTRMAAGMTMNDIAIGREYYKYKTNPDVYQVKRGIFGKRENVVINPLNFSLHKYNGNKVPLNKKVICLKKGASIIWLQIWRGT